MYDSIVDRDLIVLADDVSSLPEPPKQSQRSQEERAADAIQKMSNLLGKSGLSLIFRAFVASLWLSVALQTFSHTCSLPCVWI